MLRLLAVADVVDPALDAARAPLIAPAPDAIISCGDLPVDYLAALAGRFGCPLFYVRGNHDGGYDYAPPTDCTSVDGRLLVWRGVRLLGLGGAPTHNGGTVQYSEGAMRWRALRRRPAIWRRGGLDLLVTHAGPSFAPPVLPPVTRGGASLSRPVATPDDAGRRGFRVFGDLVRRYRPALYLHGHTHLAYGTAERERRVGPTRIVNAYGHCLVEIASGRDDG